MTSYIAPELRRGVAARAGGASEYCLIHEDDTFFGCQVDHVISEKHGGATALENLAFACAVCNRRKGSDIASVLKSTGEIRRLFNPRLDEWPGHFEIKGTIIVPKSETGEVTIEFLQLNTADRRLEREALIQVGRYPGRTMPNHG